MKRSLLFFIILIVVTSCKHHSMFWTEAYYYASYKYIDSINKKIIYNDSQRRKFTTWEIERLKVELPDGFSSIPDDSLQRLCGRIGREYNKTHPINDVQIKTAWTPQAEHEFKVSISSGNFISRLEPTLRDKYCDCMLAEFKKTYPDTISTPIPDSITINAVRVCDVKLSVDK